MNVVLIMAKDGSKGLPDKNIWKIRDKTLLGWTIDDAKKSKLVNRIYVSTNGEAVARVARDCQAEVIIRDHELAKNEKFIDAVDHAIRHIKAQHSDLQIIAVPQCVVPFRDPDIFDRCISFLLEHPGYDSAVTIRRTGYIPEALMKFENDTLTPYFKAAQERVSGSRQDSEAYEIDHAVECFRYHSWLNREQGIKPWDYLGRKIKGVKQTYHNPNCFVDIHTIEDIRWLEFIAEHLGYEGMVRNSGTLHETMGR